jgi:NAD(P)H dehydrogenase (quinone)
MHVLVVLSHPDPASLSHALAQRFIEGVEKAGHTAELADLHAEGFNPIWNSSDIAHAEGASLPNDLAEEQKRIERCNAVCMVFPLFWFGMPAMLKGWIDRVWSWGWAYDQLDDHNQSLQKNRTCIMLIPAGANPEKWEPYSKVENAMDTIWKTGTLGYFGFTEKQFHYLNGSTGSQQRREGLLQQAYQAGLDISFPVQSD